MHISHEIQLVEERHVSHDNTYTYSSPCIPVSHTYMLIGTRDQSPRISPYLHISRDISGRSVARRERDVQQHLAVSPRISPYHAEPYSSRCERHLPISPHEPQSHTTIYRSRRDPHLAISPHTSRYLPISRVTLMLGLVSCGG